MQNVTSSTAVLYLEPWSKRARTFFENSFGVESVFRFYLLHITTWGRDTRHAKGVGKVTWQEIRRKFMKHGFPDLDDKVFRMNFDPEPLTKASLGIMLDSWKMATPQKRERLRRSLVRHHAR